MGRGENGGMKGEGIDVGGSVRQRWGCFFHLIRGAERVCETGEDVVNFKYI